MGIKNIVDSSNRTIEAFIYEGENLAIKYPDGTLIAIPKNRVHTLLYSTKLPNGEVCHRVFSKTPFSNLPIVINDQKSKPFDDSIKDSNGY